MSMRFLDLRAMQFLDSNRDLRSALRLEGLDAHQHREAVQALRLSHEHSIRFVADRRDQTCATYALSLTDDPTYRAVAGIYDVYAGKAFMAWAIEGGFIQEMDTGQVGSLVCYFSGPEWCHIGVLVSPERVLSKWGTYPLYEHGLAELSEDYGERVRFYRRPSSSQALTRFIDFVHSRGFSDDDIAAARREWHE
jgi:hypothetical protein